jgi:hypothetical protein
MVAQEVAETETSMSSWFVVGDSHTRIFEHITKKGLLNRPCTVLPVGGATAVGLRHPNSITNALNIFREALLPAKPNVIPVIHLGEVDCGFVIWYRAQKHNETIAHQLRESIAAYFAFVDELRANGYSRIVVTGAILPTIRDEQSWGEVANARREVSATLKQRTDLTLRYNRLLHKGARERKILFIEITENILNKQTGVIDDMFRHRAETNHHLHPNRVGLLWATALNRLVRKRGL